MAEHDTFTIERTYPASPSRVFEAFSDPQKKARWFGCVEGWEVDEQTMDFRIGGHDVWRVGPPGGARHQNNTVYHDIVPNERIVWSYAMRLDDVCISVSLATVELRRDGSGTRMTFTEQGAFLGGYEGGEQRVRGTHQMLDHLERALSEER